MKYIIVAFDYDGTLVDSRNTIINSTQQVFKEWGLDLPSRETILKMMGIPAEVVFPQYHGGALNEEKTAKLIARYREVYLEESKNSLVLYDGVPELLQDLQKVGARVGVVTSKVTAAAWENSRQLGIDAYLEHIIGPHEVANPKPAPDPLRALCRHFGRYPDFSTIMIGDSTFDIEMGNRAGAHSCAVTWGAHSAKELKTSNPTYLVETIDELRAAL